MMSNNLPYDDILYVQKNIIFPNDVLGILDRH